MKALIGVDFSPASTAASDWVSRWFLPAAPLAVAYCVDVPEGNAFSRIHDEGHDVILKRAKDEAAIALLPLVQEFGPNRVEAMVGVGPPADALPVLAKEWKADLLAIGRGDDGSLEPLAGIHGHRDIDAFIKIEVLGMLVGVEHRILAQQAAGLVNHHGHKRTVALRVFLDRLSHTLRVDRDSHTAGNGTRGGTPQEADLGALAA